MWERALLLNKRSRGGMSNTGGGGAAARKGKGADGAKPLSALYSGWGTYRQIKIGAGFKLKNKNGPFSAVSKLNFASKYSLESSRRDLHNALLCTVCTVL